MVQLFDHYSNQVHESVTIFLGNWGKKPWNDANVPINLYVGEDDDGQRYANVTVYHPRKEHIKQVRINILTDEELEAFRKTFMGIGETLFEEAIYNLEAFAKGGMPKRELGDDDWGGMILYYWKKKEFKI